MRAPLPRSVAPLSGPHWPQRKHVRASNCPCGNGALSALGLRVEGNAQSHCTGLLMVS